MADSTDLFDIIHTTRAMRRLKPDPVPDALIRILEAGQCAPNGANAQRWRFLVIKDRAIKEKVQVWYKKAYDEVVGPHYHERAAAGDDRDRYLRQAAAAQHLTDHFHEAPVWIVACIEHGSAAQPLVRRVDLSGGAEHAAGGARAGAGLDADHAASAVREGDRGGAGPAAGRPFLRHPADRLADGEIRPGEARAAREIVYSDRWGEPWSGAYRPSRPPDRRGGSSRRGRDSPGSPRSRRSGGRRWRARRRSNRPRPRASSRPSALLTMTASPRSNAPSTAMTPAGKRLVPRFSAAAAPWSTVSAPTGLTAPAIQRLRAVRGSDEGTNQVRARRPRARPAGAARRPRRSPCGSRRPWRCARPEASSPCRRAEARRRRAGHRLDRGVISRSSGRCVAAGSRRGSAV